MNLPLDHLLRRTNPPIPWAEGETIPWSDPEFSRRMLGEHLSQSHDAASRRFETIDAHVAWLAARLPSGKPARILDLGCGPGLYAHRLAILGHAVLGIDFSPASIEYARERAEGAGLPVRYELADLRQAHFGKGHDLAMLIYGEFNVFRPEDGRRLLEKAFAALGAGGVCVLEAHPFAAVEALGKEPGSWYTSEKGLFSDRPHLCLQENFWDSGRSAATNRYVIVDLATGQFVQHSASMQAYTDEGYRALFRGCGFERIEFTPSLTGSPVGRQRDLFVITARKPEKA